jgi:hypothetical protein
MKEAWTVGYLLSLSVRLPDVNAMQKQNPGRVGLDWVGSFPGLLSIDVIGLGEVRCERRGSNTVQDKTRQSRRNGSTNKILEVGTILGTVAVCVSYLSVYLCPATNIKQRADAVWTVAETTSNVSSGRSAWAEV